MDPERAGSIILQWRDVAEPLAPVLRALEAEFGYVDKRLAPQIAEALNVPKIEVYRALYRDFRCHPQGHHSLKICRAANCRAMGSDEMILYIRDRLGIEIGETTLDGTFTVEDVYCIGMCAEAPAAMLDGKAYGCVSEQVLQVLVDGARWPC